MRRFIGTVGSLLVIGLGPAIAGRWRRAAAWVAALALAILAVWYSLWTLPLLIVLPLASLRDAYRVLDADDIRPTVDWAAVVATLVAPIVLAVVARGFVLEAFRLPSSSMSPTLNVDDEILIDKLSLRWRRVVPGEVIVFAHPCTPRSAYVERVIATAGQTVEIRCDVVYVDGKPLAHQRVPGECTYDDVDEQGTSRSRACSAYVESHGRRTYRVLHGAERIEGTPVPSGKDFPWLDDSRVPPSCARYGGPGGGRVTNQEPGAVIEARLSPSVCGRQVHYLVPADHVFALGDNRPNSNDSRFWGAIPLENVIGRVYGIWRPGRGTWRRFGGID